jgi:hypothetical protein
MMVMGAVTGGEEVSCHFEGRECLDGDCAFRNGGVVMSGDTGDIEDLVASWRNVIRGTGDSEGLRKGGRDEIKVGDDGGDAETIGSGGESRSAFVGAFVDCAACAMRGRERFWSILVHWSISAVLS